MLRLIVTLFLCFFSGVLLSEEKRFFQEKSSIAPYPVLLTLAAFGIFLVLILTAPAKIKLHLSLTALAFVVLGFRMYQEPIFVTGSGDCSIWTVGILAVALALVVAYPRKDPVPQKK
jgi:hypothetical protein